MKPQYSLDASSLVPSKFVVNEYSRTIAKVKPKIRIIHIVAPEIIKTDVENFRELVQRLTGKPAERKESKSRTKENNNSNNNNYNNASISRVLSPKPCVPIPFQDNTQQRAKEEIEEIYEEENPNAFLSYLGDDQDGFNISYMNNEYPMIRSSQMNSFGEVHFC